MNRQLPDGAKVKFRHGRCVLGSETVRPVFWKREEGETPAQRTIWADLKAQNIGLIMSPRGGVTECTVLLPDGKEITARAECSMMDNYSKKIGRAISLGRALKQIAS